MDIGPESIFWHNFLLPICTADCGVCQITELAPSFHAIWRRKLSRPIPGFGLLTKMRVKTQDTGQTLRDGPAYKNAARARNCPPRIPKNRLSAQAAGLGQAAGFKLRGTRISRVISKDIELHRGLWKSHVPRILSYCCRKPSRRTSSLTAMPRAKLATSSTSHPPRNRNPAPL